MLRSMVDTPHAAHQAADAIERPGDDAPTWLIALARAGYGARGLIYIIVGIIAITVAWWGGQAEGSRGALADVVDTTWGTVLVFIVAVGLVGYAAWRFVQSFLDADNHGTDAEGLVIRAGLLVSGLTHSALAFYAFTLVFVGAGPDSATSGGGGGASGGGGGGGGEETWSGWLLDQPGGPWILGLIGLCIVGAGVAQFVKGYKAKFIEHFDPEFRKWPWALPICETGLIARGIVFVIMGGFVMYAAYTYDPGKVRGLGGVLNTIKEQPWGSWLIMAVGLGLLAFAVYSLMECVYRRVQGPGDLPEAT